MNLNLPDYCPHCPWCRGPHGGIDFVDGFVCKRCAWCSARDAWPHDFSHSERVVLQILLATKNLPFWDVFGALTDRGYVNERGLLTPAGETVARRCLMLKGGTPPTVPPLRPIALEAPAHGARRTTYHPPRCAWLPCKACDRTTRHDTDADGHYRCIRDPRSPIFSSAAQAPHVAEAHRR